MGKQNNAPSSGQLRAIQESGQNLIVSAAAGSGKTYTLVERIVQNIIAGKYRIDELLVVTFTNAAAAEMRERIEKKLTDELGNHPELAHQLVLLSNASISTLHSFCQRLIRENFTAIDVDPKYRLLNEQERELIRQRVVREVFERKYDKQDADFLRFVRSYGSDRDDTALYGMVLDLHTFAESQPNPQAWLDDAAKIVPQWGQGSIRQAAWYPYLKDKIVRTLKACGEAAKYFCEQAETDGITKYADTFVKDGELIENLSNAAETDNWATMQEAFSKIPPRFPPLTKPKGMELDNETTAFYSDGRNDQIKEPLKELKGTYFSESEESLLEDLRVSGTDTVELCRLTLEFIEAFDAAKRKKTALDFGDLEHFALAVLNREETQAAIKKRYKEIMVDEYQDTNGVQEAILGKITDGRNLFMVGDVKQSIYRFRLADPTLFIEKQNDYRKQGGHGACIELSENYRSRKEVLAAVNFLFAQLMMEPETELSYDERAALYPKADYPATAEKSFDGAPVELLLVRKSDALKDDETEDLKGFGAESEIIAQKLRELKDSGVSVYDQDKKEYRPIRWQDMAVLLRAVKGKAQVLLEKLRAHDIPAYAEADAGYFEEKEVSLILALLAVIDNAHQDIPLAAVLHSMIGDMTAEELAEIRVEADDAPDFYTALSAKAETDAQGKAAKFLEKLGKWRKLSRRVGVPELLWQLYRDTGYYDYVGAQPGGLVRQANLRMLVDRASDYEKTNFRGLFRFLQFVRQMKDRDTDLSVARTLGEKEDVVRIMTVHKSKGLEFPVVVIADLSKQLNFRDVQKKVLVHKNLGIGMYCTRTEETLTWQYPTIAWRAMKEAIQNEARAEELRILYVAMTRAREKLILVGSVKSSVEKCAKVWCRYTDRKETALPGHAVLGANSWLDWIGPALARDETAGETLRDEAGVSELPQIDYPSSIFGEPNFDLRFVAAPPSQAEEDNEAPADEWTEHIRKLEPLPITENSERASALSWGYEYYADIPAKMTVTEIKRRSEAQEEFSFPAPPGAEISEVNADDIERDFPPPEFLQAEEIPKGGVVFGTLMHGVMQNLRLDGSLDDADIESQLDAFVKDGILTEEEGRAVNVPPIAKFFASPIGRRMKAAKRCWREQPFSLLISASEMEPKASGQDEIFLQGTIDVFFEDAEGRIILLDYKTDRATKPELIRKRYQKQLDLYVRAIQEITGMKVDEKFIYCLSDGSTIAM